MSISLPFRFLAISALVVAQIDPRLKTALTLNSTSSGVSTTPDDRLFIIWNHIDGSTGSYISEQHANGNFVPYPDEDWNAWNSSDSSQDAEYHFLNPNAQRIGPDGLLWVVDNGGKDYYYSSKLVSFNITTNSVGHVYSLYDITLNESFWDDVRFNGDKAYLTDAGAAALGILDLRTGQQRRVLEYSQYTTSWFPASAEGELIKFANGSYLYFHVDQLEVSPDAFWLYFHPLSGGFWRVPTSLLDQALCDETIAASLASHVEPFASVATSGGTAIDADGNIYSSNTDLNAIMRTSPNGTVQMYLQDERLLWVDAMWIDAQGRLWMPVNQLYRSVLTGNGTSEITKPLYVFTVQIGVGPSAIDHF